MQSHANPAAQAAPQSISAVEAALLDLVNAAHTGDDLHETLAAAGVEIGKAEALISHRNRTGSFRTPDELEAAGSLGSGDIESLLAFLGQPAFNSETETLDYVMWCHGSGLSVADPSRFGRVERRASGLRLHSQTYSREGGGYIVGQSDVIASIPTPAFALGKQFHVRSILLSMHSSPVPFDVLGRPLATPMGASLWDGHLRTADVEIRSLQSPDNRFLRLPVAATPKVRWGIGVALDAFVLAVPEFSSDRFWLEISAVGVEFVTRTSSGVVATDR